MDSDKRNRLMLSKLVEPVADDAAFGAALSEYTDCRKIYSLSHTYALRYAVAQYLAQAPISEQQVWAVCDTGALVGRDGAKCLRCPASEDIAPYGTGKKMCRAIAEQVALAAAKEG